MIINSFGGGASTDLGLTIPTANTTLWNNGTIASGWTLSPSMKTTTNSTLSSGTVLTRVDGGYNTTIGIFANLVWFVPIRGKTISLEFVCTSVSTSSPKSQFWLGIVPSVVTCPYTTSDYNGMHFIFYGTGVSPTATTTVYTASFVVPDWTVMGYIGYGGLRNTGWYCINNIKISA